MHIGKWAALLSVFWLLLSGYLQPLLLIFGAISVALVLWVLKRMDKVDNEPRRLGTGHKIIPYSTWLLGQIALSSFHVSKLVWGSSKAVSPALAKVSVEKIKPENRVLYANSITLTPGTLSVDLDDKNVTVHALQKSSLDELEEGAMENKITKTWGKSS